MVQAFQKQTFKKFWKEKGRFLTSLNHFEVDGWGEEDKGQED